ncbi:hypothetical protein EV426DRAFT_577468 [Tirmania nivea]|nr:hypothetical protein EV426DRAFT_577468 [Tirmania nivea]
MARARLRTALHYPSDSDTDSLPSHMDEEEQEALLRRLRQSDTSTNEFYSTLFSLLFVLPAIYSLLILLRKPTLISVLALSSLGITAYTVKFVPVSGARTSGGAEGEGKISIGGGGGPIERFLPVLNGVLAVVVGLGAYLQRPKGDEMELEAWAGYLPLDLSDLEKTKYKYKGA